MTIDLSIELMGDGETYAIRYVCACGCRPQVKLRRGSPAGHEHCCCGIAHAAGPDARTHLESYLAERREAGKDADRTYRISDAEVPDPWGEPVRVAYAVPVGASGEAGPGHDDSGTAGA